MPAGRVLLTGASGFVGTALCLELLLRGYSVRGAVRGIESSTALKKGIDPVVVGAIDAATDWNAVLAGREAVVHLAARVHVMHDEVADPLAEFREVNNGTLNLARQAADAGLKRFVFVSTVKVNGEGRDEAYRETDAPAPEDAYAISKWEAELGLHRIVQETGLEIVILWPDPRCRARLAAAAGGDHESPQPLVPGQFRRRHLGWVPPFSMEAGLAATVTDRI